MQLWHSTMGGTTARKTKGSMLTNGATILGVEFAPVFTPMERRLQMMGALSWCALTSIITNGVIAFIVLFFINPIIGLLYAAWVYFDKETRNRGGRRFECIRRLGIWKYFRDYFPLKLIKTAELDPSRNYLFGAHPHGILCMGPFGSFATQALEFEKLYPKLTPHLLTLEIFFWLPFARELFLAFGALPATKKSMTHILSYPGGGKVGILLPGGVPEMLESHPNTDSLRLKDRKGFIKLALQLGSPLVPVYSFGETNVYQQLGNPEGSIIRRLQLAAIRVTGYYFPLVNGRGLLQYSFGLIPKRVAITTVIGAPIEVLKVSDPTQEQIDSLHKKFISELKDLFYSHRKECGYPNAELEII